MIIFAFIDNIMQYILPKNNKDSSGVCMCFLLPVYQIYKDICARLLINIFEILAGIIYKETEQKNF